MFATLIRHEILTNLATFRFSTAVIACVLLMLATIIPLTDNYERQAASYNETFQMHQEKNFSAPTYSYLSVRLDRPPNPLSLFNHGLNKRAANSVLLRRDKVPSIWEDNYYSTGSDNPFRHLLGSIDIVSAFQILLSLLALVFAYNAIAGERENGTLRLMLANPVGRSLIVLSKYLSAMICLILSILISFLLALILQFQSPAINYSTADFLRIGGILLTTIAYVSIIYLIGLLISCTSQHTATSLITSMFIWIVLTFMYPNASLFMVNHLIETEEKIEQADREVAQIMERFQREKSELRDPFAWPFLLEGSWGGTSISKNVTYIEAESKSEIPIVKAYYEKLEPLRLRAAEETWLVRKQAYSKTFVHKSKIAQNALRFSPTGLYYLATSAYAGTDLDAIETFFSAVRQYRHTILDYFYDKKAFGSRQWFASDEGAVRWDDLPRFSYQALSTLKEDSFRATGELLRLLLLNLVLLITSIIVFSRQEV